MHYDVVVLVHELLKGRACQLHHVPTVLRPVGGSNLLVPKGEFEEIRDNNHTHHLVHWYLETQRLHARILQIIEVISALMLNKGGDPTSYWARALQRGNYYSVNLVAMRFSN